LSRGPGPKGVEDNTTPKPSWENTKSTCTQIKGRLVELEPEAPFKYRGLNNTKIASQIEAQNLPIGRQRTAETKPIAIAVKAQTL
jgi:hypothetical protein